MKPNITIGGKYDPAMKISDQGEPSQQTAELNQPNADAAKSTGAWCDHAADESEDSRQAGC